MKLKKSAVEAVSEEAKAAPGGAFISARLRNPAEELAAQGNSKGDTLGGVFAILATVMLLVVTALLYFNWEAIKSA
jgi:hypothetical protein